jgi:hypothetical protein
MGGAAPHNVPVITVESRGETRQFVIVGGKYVPLAEYKRDKFEKVMATVENREAEIRLQKVRGLKFRPKN